MNNACNSAVFIAVAARSLCSSTSFMPGAPKESVVVENALYNGKHRAPLKAPRQSLIPPNSSAKAIKRGGVNVNEI